MNCGYETSLTIPYHIHIFFSFSFNTFLSFIFVFIFTDEISFWLYIYIFLIHILIQTFIKLKKISSLYRYSLIKLLFIKKINKSFMMFIYLRQLFQEPFVKLALWQLIALRIVQQLSGNLYWNSLNNLIDRIPDSSWIKRK